jgi:hypothetical protein
MANSKISALTSATTPLAGTEVLPIVQSGATVKVANNDLRPKQIQSNATSGVLQIAGPGASQTRVMTTPDANFTAARTDAGQTFTGNQDISGNVTVQATLSSWGSNFGVLQLGQGGSVAAQTAARTIEITSNAYNNSGWKYQATDKASLYYQYDGGHYWSTAASGTAGNAISFSEVMSLNSSGYLTVLGIYNNTTASAANVFVNSSGLLFRSTSALKYKQDIRNLESMDISLLRPVRYKSKCKGDDQTKDHFGVIADEVDAAGIKELVTYNAKNEVEGFQYERLTVVLLKAIQELKAEFDAYKASHP